MIVDSREKRKRNSPPPRRRVFHCRRYGRSTSGFGLRNRRMSEAKQKTIPPKNRAVKSPERHQSSLCPWSSAANNIASPALKYRKPAKLGAGPDFFFAGPAGIPYQMQASMIGVSTAEFQNIQ